MAVVVAIALGITGWQAYWAHGADETLPWADLTSRTLAEPPAAGLAVFRSRDELIRALRAGGTSATVPPIDFRTRTAILVTSGPRSSTAFGLDVVRVREERRRRVVTVAERTPSLAEPGAATLTFPFRLITVRRSDKPVTLDWEGRP